MNRPFAALPVLVALVVLGAGWLAVGISDPSARADVLTAGPEAKWYRGNMHTHSHWSDGDDYLESIAAWYQEHGYQFLVFTDHNVLADKERWVDVDKSKGGRAAFEKLKEKFPEWVEERTVKGRAEVRLRRFEEVAEKFNRPENFLLVQGEEISDKFHTHPIHLGASNVKEVIPPHGGASVRETIQNNVDAVLAQREATGQTMIVHLNHPNFHYGVTAEDLMPIVGDRFFEVYNGHPSVHNQGDELHAGTERIWDIVLTKRLAELNLPIMYGLAVDDGHNYHDIPSRKSNPGRGWVYVLSESLAPKALIDSLEAGRFYASCGVKLARVESSPDGLAVQVDAQPGETYTIEFVGTRAGYDPSSEPQTDKEGKPLADVTRRYSPTIGEVLKRVSGPQGTYRFQGDEIYVRARVTSSALHPNPSEEGDYQMAWVQPIVGPKAPPQ